MMHQDFRPEVLAMCHITCCSSLDKLLSLTQYVSPHLSFIYGVDTGKMLLQSNPLMYHYTIQEAAGVTLLCPSWPLNSTHLIIFCILQITNVLMVWVAK